MSREALLKVRRREAARGIPSDPTRRTETAVMVSRVLRGIRSRVLPKEQGRAESTTAAERRGKT